MPVPPVPPLNLGAVSSSRSAAHSARSSSATSARSHTSSSPDSLVGRTRPSTQRAAALSERDAALVPTQRAVRRNLAAAFDAAVFVRETSAWDTSQSPSPRAELTAEPSGQDVDRPMNSDRSTGSGVYAYVSYMHDVALHDTLDRFGTVVDAMVSVLRDIAAIDQAPPSSGEGYNTPLWSEKVEQLADNLMDRLLPLAFSRAMARNESCESGALYVTDAFDGHHREYELGMQLIRLHQDILALSHVHGSDTLERVLSHGLQTRDWRASGNRSAGYMDSARRAANDLLSLLAELPAHTTNALTRGALESFYRNP